MKWFLMVFMMFGTYSYQVSAQQVLKYQDYEYLDHIKSVQLFIDGLPTSNPIINLGSGAALRLAFDDILGGDREYSYRLIHCDKDWNPSDRITEADYLIGYNDEEIREYSYSIGTRTDYTHYELVLPNRQTNWRISGNYLLVVRDEESDEIALSRRFMVAESKVRIYAEVQRALASSKSRTHQEIDLAIVNDRFPIVNPQQEIFVTVMQNGRWDNIQTGFQPRFTIGDRIEFDRTYRIGFEAYNEFRGADLRSLRSRGYGVSQVKVDAQGIIIYMEVDQKRQGIIYTNIDDLNGSYIIETLEYNQDNIRAEYVETSFAIESLFAIPDAEVYIVGKFTNWQPREEFRLKYDFEQKLYYGGALLKQGFYDYQYVVLYNDGTYDLLYFEGSHYATRNEYQILVYYRTITERYDRLIGVESLYSTF